MKTMVCDMCGMVAEKDNPVGRYSITLRLLESTNEVDHNLEDEAKGHIDFCEDCLAELIAKTNREDV